MKRGAEKGRFYRNLHLTTILKLPFRGLRLFVSVPLSFVKFLLVLLALLCLTVTANCLKSSAASELTDNRYSFTYFVNGDFVQNGLDKSLMFYEYLPSGLSWDTLNSMVANFTADGVRCEYRIFGYKSGGGGTLVFDSGGGGKYGQAIDITGANFDYFNILLSAYDKEGNQIEVGNIDSGYIVWGYGELVQLPTTPPSLLMMSIVSMRVSTEEKKAHFLLRATVCRSIRQELFPM